MRRIRPGQELRFVSQNESCLTRVVGIRGVPHFSGAVRTRRLAKDQSRLPIEDQPVDLKRIFRKDKKALGVRAIQIARLEA